MVSIKTDKTSEEQLKKRAACHIAVVLDTSGSMHGGRLKWSKRGIRKLIKHLVPNKDKIHVVCYGSNSYTAIEDGDLTNKEALEDKVRAITTAGCTNMCDGLTRAVNLMKKHRSSFDKETQVLERIFVFSDGQVNEGIQSIDGISQFIDGIVADDIILSSFGIGQGFNEELMRSIADRGRGDFFYIADPEQATKVLSKAIHGMLEVSCYNASLSFVPLSGFQVQSIYFQTASKGDNQVKIGDLHPENTTNMIVLLDKDHVSSSSSPLPLYHYTLSYQTVEGNSSSISGILSVPLSSASSQEAALDVTVAKMAWETAQENKEINDMLQDESSRAAAISKKKDLIDRLSSIRSKDTSGVIDRLVTSNEKSLSQIQDRRNNIGRIKKQMFMQNYMEEANNDWMYESGEDSDDDNWSEDEDDDFVPQQLSNSLHMNSNLIQSNVFLNDDANDYDSYS
eukprot:CAMPEP_0117426688 /NCGR_PEP_ID=MMETSP0758-20121206/6731_1 /TAXON_ID=63605 /ORGANISM="Percolomonas cosmopolitus, Strain AE-1 (ATCC 50343)" /LENGTH=452 /DNA_ID=CAMNT_0005211965 /DNA_START=93 /DNA_END=1447 /DNA_ORIENTATION=-